jgi:hypothetical protein
MSILINTKLIFEQSKYTYTRRKARPWAGGLRLEVGGNKGKLWNGGNWEPACGTERSEASANNIGVMETQKEDLALVLFSSPVFHYYNVPCSLLAFKSEMLSPCSQCKVDFQGFFN